jgi:hypothetical protein
MAAGDVTLQNHIPVWVIFGTTNLGLCDEGDITVEMNESWVNQLSHQTGRTPIDSFYAGNAPIVNITFIEVMNWDLWKVAFPYGEKQQDTFTPPHTRFVPTRIVDNTSSRFVGHRATGIANELILRPEYTYNAAATEEAIDVHFPKAFCSSVGTIPFSVDTPNRLPMTFTVLRDIAASSGQSPWYRGLKTPTGSWVAV